MGAGVAGGLLLPPLMNCSTLSLKKLPFTGTVQSEDTTLGHGLKDNRLVIPSPKSQEPIYDAVIVGGGPSGLATAWKLQKSGIKNYLVLEKEDVCGGLCRGGEEKGLGYACGSHFAKYHNPDTTALTEIYQDCGIVDGYYDNGWPKIDDFHLLKPNARNIFADGYWLKCPYPFQLANDEEIIEYERFIEHIEEWSDWQDKEKKLAF